MPSASVAEWRRNWRLALGATIGNGTGIGLYTYISSLFIPSFQAEFGWTRGEIGSAAAAGYFGAFAAPLVGRGIDRYGVRVMATLGALVVGACYLGYAFQNGSLIMLSLLAAGTTVAAPANSSTVFAKSLAGWFVKSRGLAFGLTACGIPVMALFMPLILQWIIAGHGWRMGYVALSVTVLLIGLPVVLATVREAPTGAERGQERTGADAGGGLTLREAVRTRNFWLLLAAVFFCTAPAHGFLSQLTSLVIDKGFTAADAALLLSIYSGAVIVGRVGTGILLDRLPPYHVAFAVTFVPVIGLFVLLSGVAPSFALVAAAVALIGVQNGGESDILPWFLAREFGLRSYSTIYGVVFTGAFMAAASGVLLLGRLYDATGSYQAALWTFAAFFTIAASSYFAMRYRHLPKAARPAAAAFGLAD
ncbi:hypothetical protein A0J57_18850 [Sphingobium sp. 22B]|nr:MFS transporter [Sphingobium sp. 22B]KXU30498.1 hypothetical protein AXW74_17455 [Sphingobium sp. AM]KYC30757.1 hypothetical protein A0J57_18850 [Sphingobium sp. 22B]OAP30055.1 hypothetical protein A8O16_20435 [Sphingobium sp. 20006FA]